MSKILLISSLASDQPEIREFLLETAHQLVIVTTEFEAESAISANTSDLILADYHAALKFGLIQPTEIGNPSFTTPWLLLVNQSDFRSAVEWFQAQTFDILTRPLDQNTFLSSISRALQFKQIQDENLKQEDRNRMYQAELEELIKHQSIRLHESEQTFKTLFEYAPLGMCIAARDGTVLQLNYAMLKLSAFDPEKKYDLGKLSDFFFDKSESDELLNRLEKKERILKHPTRLVRFDGHSYDALVSVVPMAFKGLSCIMLVIQDVSDLQEARHDIENERHFLDSIIDNIPLAIVVRDATDHSIIKVNKATEDLLGYSKEEIIGNPESNFLSPDEIKTFIKHDLAVIQSKKRVDVLNEGLTTYHNGVRHLHIRKFPIVDNENEVKYVVGISEDVTEKMLSERALIEAKVKAQSLSDLRTSMLENLGHEIRTPLSTIIGFSQILEEDLKGDQAEQVQWIAQSARRLMTTMEAVMDLSLIESGNIKLNLRVLDIGSEVESVVRSLQLRASKKGLALEISIQGGPIKAILDKKSLKTIIRHLVVNAIKFSLTGSIFVNIRSINNVVEIEVRDSGIGIEPSFIPVMFESFQQESKGNDRSFGGNGLGLAIVKSLVELHRGTIKVVSKKGRGSSFTVSFPLLTVVNPSTTKILSNRSRLKPQKRIAKARVLVFDDDKTSEIHDRSWLQSMPEVEYCNWADSPSNLFKLAQERDYNLFLITLDHQDMKVNLELIHDLRESISSSASCIVALKQSFTQIEERDLKSLGFDACLTNPPEKSQLKVLINDHFNPAGTPDVGFPVLVQRSQVTT